MFSRYNCSCVLFFFSFIPPDPKLFKSSATVLDFAFDHSDGISYSVTRSRMNWEEAQKSCNNNASELASILDAYSQSLLFLIAQEYGEPLWIGLNSNMVRTHAIQIVKLTQRLNLLYAFILKPIGISATILQKTAYQCSTHLHWHSPKRMQWRL